MVKHIKLFENWAEENVDLPEWLDPNVHVLPSGMTLFHDTVQHLITGEYITDLELGVDRNEHIHANFKSFSDYDFWKSKYNGIYVGQSEAKYKLEDLIGIPETVNVGMVDTYIKSLMGVENLKLDWFSITNSYVENLKYCPHSATFNFSGNPLLSYYKINTSMPRIKLFIFNMCGNHAYAKEGYSNDMIPSGYELRNPKFNADIFCHFKSLAYFSGLHKNQKEIKYNPWINVYEDPNEVENYEFLFMPFYEHSEKFRDKAKEYLPNIDLSGVTIGRNDLW